MSKGKTFLFTGAIILFLILLSCSIFFESTQFLYAASAVPIFIVMLLPDIRQNQYIELKKDRGVRLVHQTAGDEPLLLIDFEPGFIRWNCNKVYFDLNELSQASRNNDKEASSSSASLSVLAFDLSLHPRKSGWVGIDLSQLTERTRSLSYTTDEVTRLVIRMSDLEEAAVRLMSSASGKRALSRKNKSLQA